VITRILITATATAVLSSACGRPAFDKPLKFGDRVVEVATLERGQDLYNRYCATCHGYSGKADTPQARQLDPHPRDLSVADFKRVETPGALPTDAELGRLITNGIPGTGMPPWPQLQGTDLDAVIQYLKTFSPRWQNTLPGSPQKGEKGSMKALPATRSAASFRAADDLGNPDKGTGNPNDTAGLIGHPSIPSTPWLGLTSTTDTESHGLDGQLPEAFDSLFTSRRAERISSSGHPGVASPSGEIQ
jgi:mono/diheme cytochrome c family protein